MAAKNPIHPIPHPPKTPFIGNLLSLGTTAPIQDMMRLARELGPIFWLDMMGSPLVIVSGQALVDELCDETRFDKTTRGTLRRLRVIGGDALFTADTQMPNWSRAHNILLPTFGHRAMQSYHPMMLDIAEQMMLKWERLTPEDEIDVADDMTRLTLDTIGLCGFDYRFNSFYREGNHPLVDAMVTTLETTMKTRGLPLETLIKKDQQRKLERDVRYMNEMVDGIIRERRRGGAAKRKGKSDLLDYMLSGVDKKTGEGLDDVNIRYQCNTFLIAGHETTSGMLSFTTYFLLKNPGVLVRAYEEVDRVLGPDPTVKPTFAQVNQLTYISQILKESLRLWPTAAAYAFAPLQDTMIGGQYKLKRRHTILLLAPMLHRDPAVWGEQAETFDPDRFARDAESALPPNAYKPFGNGQRACIGRQFALQEAALVVGMMLQRFKLLDHTNYKLKVKETLTLKPDGLKMKVRLRDDSSRKATKRPTAAASAAATVAASSAVPAHGTPLLVLFGSNLGTSEEFARQIAEAGERNGFTSTLAALDDYAGRLPKEVALAIVTGSYNGAAPDNAASFLRWVREGAAAGSLAGIKYTVFGCGNRDWSSTYQSIPRAIDERLEALGARRIYARGEGDAREDLDGQFQAWSERLWESVTQALAIDVDLSRAEKAEPLYSIEIVPAPQANPLVAATGAMAMEVSVNRELQNTAGANPSERSTRHIEVKLPGGLSYRAGDHLSVVPGNAEALVERVLNRFGFERDTHVRMQAIGGRKAFLPVDETIAVQRLLASHVELQQVATRKQIAALAEHTRCPFTKPKLAALSGSDEAATALYRAEVSKKRKSVLDLLEEFPACELPFNVYLEMLPLMVPRYYSISSSPLADEGRCSITVAVVEGPARSGRGTYQGVCSTFLRRQAEGSVIHAFVKETTAGFRLPDDPWRPIVMIGPGTGLAPFRGFLRERAALKAQGKELGEAILFFGCRHRQQDYIYGDELEAYAKQGLTQLYLACSRMDGKKTYVQDLVKQHWSEVWKLLDAGAKVYVCGDGSKMEPDVRRALGEMYCTQTRTDEAGAERWLADLTGQNRYVLDVWAGN